MYLLERIAVFERQVTGGGGGGGVTPQPSVLGRLETPRALERMPAMGMDVHGALNFDPTALGVDPTVTELAFCCGPTDDCVVLATVTPAVDDNTPMPSTASPTARAIMSNDALFETDLGYGDRGRAVLPVGQAATSTIDGHRRPAGRREEPRQLPEPIVATVTDADGKPVAGAQVTFAVTEGGGKFEPASPKTEARAARVQPVDARRRRSADRPVSTAGDRDRRPDRHQP